MATVTRELEFRCSDDCLQSGCPGHKATLEFYSASCMYKFNNGKGDIIHFESGELDAFISLLKSLNRKDSIQI